jgi:hypothetical protein
MDRGVGRGTAPASRRAKVVALAPPGPLYSLPNRRRLPPPPFDLGPDDYLGWYDSDTGEQLFFVQRPGPDEPVLYVGARRRWTTYELGTPGASRRFTRAEVAWYDACVLASVHLRALDD